MVYFDLNVPIPFNIKSTSASKKDKGKGKQQDAPNVMYSAAQLSTIEARVDMLVHLGYTVIAFTQTVSKKVDPKTQPNILDPLLLKLKERQGVVFLKRLNIVIDEDSEKGFGLTSASTPFLQTYDIVSLVPLTIGALSLACLTHSQPSPITAHIIALPLSLPRLPYHLKHTLVRTAKKNGAVFEINYGGALGASAEEWEAGEIGGAVGERRNWWATTREIVRVTKGKGIVVSSGVTKAGELRAPKDIENLITFLDLPSDAAHEAMSTSPKALIIRAQTRTTYRAVLSEPKLIVPANSQQQTTDPPSNPEPSSMEVDLSSAVASEASPAAPEDFTSNIAAQSALEADAPFNAQTAGSSKNSAGGKKRPRSDSPVKNASDPGKDGAAGKRKKKRQKGDSGAD